MLYFQPQAVDKEFGLLLLHILALWRDYGGKRKQLESDCNSHNRCDLLFWRVTTAYTNESGLILMLPGLFNNVEDSSKWIYIFEEFSRCFEVMWDQASQC
jgi:hypothetical protein